MYGVLYTCTVPAALCAPVTDLAYLCLLTSLCLCLFSVHRGEMDIQSSVTRNGYLSVKNWLCRRVYTFFCGPAINVLYNAYGTKGLHFSKPSSYIPFTSPILYSHNQTILINNICNFAYNYVTVETRYRNMLHNSLIQKCFSK